MMQNLFEWLKHYFLYLQHSFPIHSQWDPVALGKRPLFVILLHALLPFYIHILYLFVMIWFFLLIYFLFLLLCAAQNHIVWISPNWNANKCCNCKYCKWVANNKWYLSLIQEMMKIYGIIDLKSQHWLKSSI